MEKKQNSISIYMMLVGLLLIQIGKPLREYTYMSLGTSLIALAAGLAFLFTIITEKINKELIKILIIFIVSLFSMMIASTVNSSNMITLICFLEIPLFFYAYQEIKSTRIKKTIYLIYFALSIFYILSQFGENAYVLFVGESEYIGTDLTLGYNNPNEAAMYLFVCFAVLLTMLFDIKKKFFKLIILADMSYVAYMIWQTNSRTMMALQTVLIVGAFLFRNKRLPSIFVVFSFLIPFLFIFVLQWYGGATLFGESLETGRLEIFARVTEKMTVAKVLLGDYNLKFDNLHNMYISVFGTIGIIGVVTFIWFLMQKTEHALKNASNRMNRIAAVGFLSLIISSSTETALFTAGSAFAASVITLYLLSILKEGEKNESLTD